MDQNRTEITPSGQDNSQPQTSREPRNRDLVDRIKKSADQLASDGSSRGDLKILSRTLRELRHAFKVFSPYRRRRKVTVFGSARTPPDDPAYQSAVQFGKRMAEADWFVVTGAASGIMEAGHQGAGREHSMGLNILLPFEQESNPIIHGDRKLVHMKYFFTRKLMFVKECHAVVCMPGGFGTLDEALEVLTLLQTGKRDMVPVVLLNSPGDAYWRDLNSFIHRQLLAKNMIAEDDLSLYTVTDSVTAAVDEVLNFYRVYHSMRYIKNQLVLRLNQKLHPSVLANVNGKFNDILVDGEFQQRAALPDERGEPSLKDLPRLVFHFDRRSLGRLRQLIDFLNCSQGGSSYR